MSFQFILHYTLHLLFPALIAVIYNKKNWLRNYLLLLATMLIDTDHLLANPVFDACRCSIGYHPLHSLAALAVYVVFLFVGPLRIVGIGLIFHLVTDAVDCYMSSLSCQ